MIKGHGHVSITNTTFDKFSNCGSIIRDTRELDENFEIDETDDDTISVSRGFIMSGKQIREKLYISPSTA